MQTSDNVTFQLLLNSRNSHRVPTDHKSGRVRENQGTDKVRETSRTFVTGQGTIACIMRLSNWCSNNIYARNVIIYFDWIFSICFVIFKVKVLAYMCIIHNSDGADKKNCIKPWLSHLRQSESIFRQSCNVGELHSWSRVGTLKLSRQCSSLYVCLTNFWPSTFLSATGWLAQQWIVLMAVSSRSTAWPVKLHRFVAELTIVWTSTETIYAKAQIVILLLIITILKVLQYYNNISTLLTGRYVSHRIII